VTLGLKYKLIIRIFGGAKPHLVSDAHAEHTRKELMRMLSIRVRNWCVCSACALVPYAYAQYGLKVPFQIWNSYAYAEHTRKNLMRMLRVRISSWLVCSANASVPDPYAHMLICPYAHKDWSMRVRNSIFLIIFKVPKTSKILKNRYWH
jgi:hypothetical protein